MSIDRFMRWGAGKPSGFVMIARRAAASAEEMCQFVNLMLAGEFRKFPPPPSARSMLNMYKNHRAVSAVVGEFFCDFQVDATGA